jgi:hypothetical protein
VLGAGPHLLNRRMEFDGSFLGGDPDFPDAPKRTDTWLCQDYGDVPASALRIELRLVGGEAIREMFNQEQVCSSLGLQGRDREYGRIVTSAPFSMSRMPYQRYCTVSESACLWGGADEKFYISYFQADHRAWNQPVPQAFSRSTIEVHTGDAAQRTAAGVNTCI